MDARPNQLGNNQTNSRANLFINQEFTKKQFGELPFNSSLEAATDSTLDYFVKEDHDSTKSRPRLLVERKLCKYSWYNPHIKDQKEDNGRDQGEIGNMESETFNNDSIPSIQRAWAFYEHFTVPRHKDLKHSNSRRFRSPIGSIDKTDSFYSIWSTPIRDLESFGIGMVLYFDMLKFIAIILFTIGLINIPNILYFGSQEYSGGKSGGHSNMDWIARMASGTAICTEREWVICPTCDLQLWEDKFDISSTKQKFGVTHVKKNMCEGLTDWNWKINYTSLILIIIGLFLCICRQKIIEIVADEGNISTSDYSITVHNPPPDATDPEEWRDFFSLFDRHAPPLVTIALKNRELIKTLIKMKSLSRRLENIRIEKKKKDKGRKTFLSLLQNPNAEQKVESQLQGLKVKVQALEKKAYPVDKVFITMETEAGQRKALTSLSTGKLVIWKKKKDDSVLTFHGRILNVSAALEPSQIMWRDLSTKIVERILRRMFTFFILIALIVFGLTLLNECRRSLGLSFTVIIVRLSVALSPRVAIALASIESHPDDEQKQISILAKCTLLRWVSTSVIWIYLTPFTKLLQGSKDDFIPMIFKFFIIESFMPLVKALDLRGQLKKHFKAPRSKTQREMNMCFQGTPVSIAERYTEMTKIMFLTFVFSAIWPASFLAGATALAVQFFADKYALMRVWAAAPDVGSRLAKANNLFVGITIMAFAFFSLWFWWGFPFDNLCLDGQVAFKDLFGDNMTENAEDIVQTYKECNQRLDFSDTFPLIPSLNEMQWMSETQKETTTLYGWTVMGVVFCLVFIFVARTVSLYVLSLFKGKKMIITEDQNVDFSSICDSVGIKAYVPQVQVPGYERSFFICHVGELDETLIGWKDVKDSNLIYDAQIANVSPSRDDCNNNEDTDDMVSSNEPNVVVFSIVKHWSRFK